MYVKIVYAHAARETLFECETVHTRVSAGPGDFADEADRPRNFMEVLLEKPSGTITVWLERGELKVDPDDSGPRKHQVYVMNEHGKTIESMYW